MMAVDEVVTAWGNLREDHRMRQVGCDHGQLIQNVTLAGKGYVVQQDELGAESSGCANVGQEPRDVELEDPIRIELLTLQGLARSKVRVEITPSRHAIRTR
jgi:hypothetical protein